MKKIFLFLIDAFRPLLGPRGTCIYPITCREYARFQLEHKPFYIAIPLIGLRLLSCNPITALILRIKHKIKK